MEEQTLGQPVPVQKDSSSLSFRGIFEVFYKPAEFFKELKDNPKILVPYIVLIVIAIVSMFLLSDMIVQMQLDSPEVQERLSAAGVSSIPPGQIRIMKYSTIIIGALSVAIYPLLLSAFALFFGNFVFAGKASFKNVLAVSLYGSFVYYLGGMVLIPLMLTKGTMLVSFSLGVFVADQGLQSVAYTALSKIGLFQIWEFIVTGIGFGIIYDFNRNKGITLAVLSIGLILLIHVGLAAIGTMFG